MKTALSHKHICVRTSRVVAAARYFVAGAAAVRQSRSMAVQALTGHIPGFRQRVAEVNNGLDEAANLMPFCVDGQRLGYLKPDFAQQLLSCSDVFQVQHTQPAAAAATEGSKVITIDPQCSTTEARTQAVATVLTELHEKHGLLTGWRNELYPVTPAFDAEPLLLIERAAAPYFGIRAYGVHINGFVVRADSSKALWVARRSPSKQTWPGKLDHIVAGGQPYGLSCAENVAKECWEEAGVPQELAAAAVPVGCISYVSMSEEGLKPDALFCYDLQLPADFVPQPQDGEVEEFMLWDLDKVARVISGSDDYKPNCCLVIIDFLIRHGYITPEEPGYLDLVKSLRVGDPL